MLLPTPRGALSRWVVDALRGGDPDTNAPEAEHRDDEQLALWTLYELHYRGFDDAREDAEWDPVLLAARARVERDFEARLRARVSWPASDDPVSTSIERLIEQDESPSLARFVQRQASIEQVHTLLRHRSIYHLKESDPVAWVIPRLEAGPKAPLAALQYDEYGDGDPRRLHHELFARALEAVGLRSEYGAYVDGAPWQILELNNAMSLFGLHRRLRAAAIGHLAAFEATSSLPSRAMARGLRRLGLSEEAAAYYDEHVEADAVHEQLALRLIADVLVNEEPDQRDQVIFGAATCLDLEARYARHMIGEQEERDDPAA